MSLLGPLVILISCLLVLRGTLIPVRNNIDEFINDLNRQGRWAMYAAIVAVIGSALDVARVLATT